MCIVSLSLLLINFSSIIILIGYSSSTKYYLDYFIKELNICIEFNGNAWHGNPKLFKPKDHCHPIYKELTAKDLQNKDRKRIKELKDKGITTYIIWESDFDPKKFDAIKYIYNELKIEL